MPLRRLEDPNADDLRALIERISVEPDPELEENEAVVDADGERAHGRAEQILFPSWTDMSADGDALARRSEADAGAVHAARDELASAAPEAGALRRILEDAT